MSTGVGLAWGVVVVVLHTNFLCKMNFDSLVLKLPSLRHVSLRTGILHLRAPRAIVFVPIVMEPMQEGDFTPMPMKNTALPSGAES